MPQSACTTSSNPRPAPRSSRPIAEGLLLRDGRRRPSRRPSISRSRRTTRSRRVFFVCRWRLAVGRLSTELVGTGGNPLCCPWASCRPAGCAARCAMTGTLFDHRQDLPQVPPLPDADNRPARAWRAGDAGFIWSRRPDPGPYCPSTSPTWTNAARLSTARQNLRRKLRTARNCGSQPPHLTFADDACVDAYYALFDAIVCAKRDPLRRTHARFNFAALLRDARQRRHHVRVPLPLCRTATRRRAAGLEPVLRAWRRRSTSTSAIPCRPRANQSPSLSWMVNLGRTIERG